MSIFFICLVFYIHTTIRVPYKARLLWGLQVVGCETSACPSIFLKALQMISKGQGREPWVGATASGLV